MPRSPNELPDESVPAQTLASQLFTHFVLGDETSLFDSLRFRYEHVPRLQLEAFHKQVFLYLIATVAIALMNESYRQPAAAKVIEFFKHLVHEEVVRRGQSVEDVDNAVEKASVDLHALLFTDPAPSPTKSFDWTQAWLRQIAIVEFNPATLFQVSQTWRNQHVTLAKLIGETQITA